MSFTPKDTPRTPTRNPHYREFLKKVRSEGLIPDNLTEYFGYGLYVGRKSQI